MAELKSCLEKNIARLQSKIEAELTAAYHYPAKVLVITPEQLQHILEAFPFPLRLLSKIFLLSLEKDRYRFIS